MVSIRAKDRAQAANIASRVEAFVREIVIPCERDERPTLGHFVEYLWFSPPVTAFLEATIPKQPLRDG